VIFPFFCVLVLLSTAPLLQFRHQHILGSKNFLEESN
jgi:hypothetical protein